MVVLREVPLPRPLEEEGLFVVLVQMGTISHHSNPPHLRRISREALCVKHLPTYLKMTLSAPHTRHSLCNPRHLVDLISRWQLIPLSVPILPLAPPLLNLPPLHGLPLCKPHLVLCHLVLSKIMSKHCQEREHRGG